MTVSIRLSRMVKYHLAAGILFSLALFSYLLLDGYRASVLDIQSSVASIRSNAEGMAEDTRRIEERKILVRKALPAGYDSRSPQETMLLSIERLKAAIKDSSVIIEDFSEANAILQLPVVVEFETGSYQEGTRLIEAIQALSLPYFEFRNIDIRRLDASNGATRYKIEGVMTMPAGKLEKSVEAEKFL